MPDQAEPLLSAHQITVSFGGVDVVRKVDLDLRPGEIHALIGENGAGKSSLAKVIAGVYQPREGRIRLSGRPIRFKSPREALKGGVALIHQEPLTFPDLDIAENIFAGHLPRDHGVLNWREAYAQAGRTLTELGVSLQPREKVGGLSVAQQQMVELAAALTHQAKIWIFDETTAPLTPKEVEELFSIMRRLRDQGCSLVMVTHHLDEVFAIADRITVLRDGVKVGERLPANTNVDEIISMMVGRELRSESLPQSNCGGEPLLEVKQLSGPGFSRVSFAVRAGEVVGLAGLVGAGRTEVGRALFGITHPSEGEIVLHGETIFISSPKAAMKLGIGLVPEDRQHEGLLMPQSISFNATLAHLAKLSRVGWMSSKRQKSALAELSGQLHLAHRSQEQPVRELSGGNQQKVVLAKWLMTRPKLLILDEPTRGVDVGAKHEVHKLIRELASDGVAVLMISSDLPEVLRLSDRIVVMRNGKTVAEFHGSEATEQQVMLAATGQEAGLGA